MNHFSPIFTEIITNRNLLITASNSEKKASSSFSQLVYMRSPRKKDYGGCGRFAPAPQTPMLALRAPLRITTRSVKEKNERYTQLQWNLHKHGPLRNPAKHKRNSKTPDKLHQKYNGIAPIALGAPVLNRKKTNTLPLGLQIRRFTPFVQTQNY